MAVEYNQHTWGYGEEFTPDKLNNMEHGIKAASDAVNEVNNNLTDALTPLTSNVADIVGGYKITGNIVYIDMRITPTNINTGVSYRQVLAGLPIPVRLDYVPISCVSVSTGQVVLAVISSEGALFIQNANNNVAYYLNGCYVKDN